MPQKEKEQPVVREAMLGEALRDYGYFDLPSKKRALLVVSKRDAEGKPLKHRISISDLKKASEVFVLDNLSHDRRMAALEAAHLVIQNLPMLGIFVRPEKKEIVEVVSLKWIPFKEARESGVKSVCDDCTLFISDTHEWWIVDKDGDMVYEAPTAAEDAGTAKRMCVRAASAMKLL